MTVLSLVLVLVSALLHASWNTMLKKEERADIAALSAAVIAAATSAVIALFMPGPAFPHPSALLWGIAAGMAEGGYLLTLALAFRNAPLTVAYPIARGGAIIAVWPPSVLWLGEHPSGFALAGSATVFAGLVLLAFEGRAQTKSLLGVSWAFVCSICIALYHLFYKQALAYKPDPAALTALSLTGALPLLGVRLGSAGMLDAARLVRARPIPIIGAGVLSSASFVVFLLALRVSGTGAVLTLRNTSVLFAVGLSYLIGERPTRRAIVAAGVIAVGAVLVGWS